MKPLSYFCRFAWVPIACAFLLVSFSRIDDGGTNARARFATLRAMFEENTFRIDHYVDWTDDWSKTPDGHFYSNKAPGPVFAAYPVFYVIDKILYPIQNRHKDERGRREAPRGIHKVLIAAVFQVIPFLIFTILIFRELYFEKTTKMAYLLGLLAVLFGNTAACLLTSYTGNPFTATAILGFSYFYLRRKIAWATFFFAWAVLSEYTAAALVIPFSILIFLEMRNAGWRHMVGAVVLGAIIPAILWCWYHKICFGGILSLPYQYDVAATTSLASHTGISKYISFLPSRRYMAELLFGPSRGLLFTQAWIFPLSVFGLIHRKKMKNPRMLKLFLFAGISLFILLWINAGFPGWHGGGSPGPRYLAAVIPVFGIFVPYFYDQMPSACRKLLGITIFLSLVLRALVYASWILPPPEPIWPYYVHAMKSPTEWIRLGIFAVIFGLALWWYAARSFSVSRVSIPTNN